MLWATVLLIGVLIVLILVLWYARSVLAPPSKSGAVRDVDMEKMTRYLKKAKVKQQEAWTNIMTAFSEDQEQLNSVYEPLPPMSLSAPTGMSSTLYSEMPAENKPRVVPPNFMQLAFFNFWKIPPQYVPKSKEEANRFIEAYKLKLREEGHTQRVRRWSRLELLMARFCAEYDVQKLNERSKQIGLNQPVLDLLLDTTLRLLIQHDLSWKTVFSMESYDKIIKKLGSSYPKLNLAQYSIRKNL